jgi:hypothetical protein
MKPFEKLSGIFDLNRASALLLYISSRHCLRKLNHSHHLFLRQLESYYLVSYRGEIMVNIKFRVKSLRKYDELKDSRVNRRSTLKQIVGRL